MVMGRRTLTKGAAREVSNSANLLIAVDVVQEIRLSATTSPKFLIYPAVDETRLWKIEAAADRVRVVQALEEAEAVAEIVDADAVFGRVTPTMLAAAGRLVWVQAPTASLEHYLFDELIAHPCVLTNMRGLFSDVIADHVLGYVLVFARNLHVYLANQQERRWAPVGGESARAGFVTGPGSVSAIDVAHQHLGDATLGIVGLGHIGREIARRARAFSMRVVAVDVDTRQESLEVEQIWLPDRLDLLLCQSDFVVIAAPHTPATVGMFADAQFRQMKTSAYLINIGRGAIVELAALDAALASGEIAGAALDVFEIEPLPESHPLWQRPNVIITPHVAGCSPRIAERHIEVVLDNLARFARGAPLRNVVDKSVWF